MTEKTVLILACGNPSRGDDALGPSLLENLQSLPAALMQPVECLTDFQLQIEHALDLKHRSLVLFVDATVSKLAPINLSQLQAVDSRGYTTHAMNPAAIMQVYQDIEKAVPPPCFLLTLQGIEFELGADLSATAVRSLEMATNLVQRLLEQATETGWQQYLTVM